MNKKKKLDIIKKQIFEHSNVVSSIVKIDNEILLFVNVLIETIKKKKKNNNIWQWRQCCRFNAFCCRTIWKI